MTDEHPLIRFNIPAAFVVEKLLPTGAELAYGFREGWLERADVVEIALARYKARVPMSAAEEEVALLLDESFDHLEDLVTRLEAVDEPSERRARVWLFLALAWVLEHQENFEDPLEVVELLYADFDYPDEIRGLVRFMPAEPGEATGPTAIERRWRAFVERVSNEYRDRDRRAG